MAARVRDWKSIDAAHRKRGELLTIVFCKESAGSWMRPPYEQKTGTPKTYSDDLIEALLTMKLITRFSLRATEGFAYSMAKLLEAEWPIPHYSTLSRRQETLKVELDAKIRAGVRHVLMVDSTGLKVFGEGEWKVRQHGVDKRRTWVKMHILVDRESGDILEVETTDKDVADVSVLPRLLPEKLDGDVVLGDGAYHSREAHRDVFRRGGTLLSPPPKNASVWKPYHWVRDEPAFRHRNSQLTHLQRLGRTRWKIESGCSKRSFVEATMNRMKSLTGASLSARTPARQKTEVRLRCKALNALSTSTWSAPS